MTINTQKLRSVAESLARKDKMRAAIREAADTIDAQTAQIVRLRDALTSVIGEVDDLIGESSGVYGLRLNGDPSPWGEVVAGGRFERLGALEEARRCTRTGTIMIDNQVAGDLRRCCDALEADNKRLRESLQWTASALQEACHINEPITEGDLFFMGAASRTASEILNTADAALAQEQS